MTKTIIGLTGKFCSGKSQVASLFALKGAILINADEIGHLVLHKNVEVKKKLVICFGKDILNNDEIDRAVLREKVFKKDESIDKLNDIVHPELINEIEKTMDSITDGIIVLEAAILFGLGLAAKMDKVVAVKAVDEKCIERAVLKGLTVETAKNILKNQTEQEKIEKRTDFVINNNGTLDDLKEGVEKLWKEIQKVQEV